MQSRRSRSSPSAQDSWTPPAGGEEPGGVGVEEAPEDDQCGKQHEAERLITAKGVQLLRAPFGGGLLLGMRLDATIDHASV